MANVIEVIFQGVDQITRNTSEINRSLQTLNRLAVRAGGALAAAFSVREIGRSVDTMVLIENRIRLVTDSVEELTAVQEKLFEVAQNTRSAFAPTVELYARVARSTRDLGITQQEVIDLTETVNQAIQVSGATAQEASAGVIQFAQGLASGAIRGDELRSVLEQMPRLAIALADGLGVSIGQLRQMGQAGELTTARILDALQSQAPKIAAEFAKITPTIEGAFQTVQNSLTQFVSDLGDASGATDGLIGFLLDLSDKTDTFADAVLGSLEPTDDLTEGMQNLATVAIVTATALQIVLNSLAVLPRLGKAGVKEVSGFAAALTLLAQGDLDAAATASREAMADASNATKLSFVDTIESIVTATESASDRISEIFLKAFRESAPDVDLDKERKRKLQEFLDQLGDAKKLTSELAKIDLNLATFDMNAVGVELYKLELLGATDAQLELAQGSLNLIAALENNRDTFKELQEAGAAVFKATRQPLEAYMAEIARLDVLLTTIDEKTGKTIIDQETFDRAARAAHDAFKEAEAAGDEWAQRLESIADEAARSMQRAFSDFLFDPFEDGLKGMVVGFLNAIRRMLADEATIKLFSLFGGGSSGGGLGGIFKAIGSLFGGKGSLGPPRAHGGFTIPGSLHPVNEREPEFLLTRGRSEVVPLSKMAAAGAGGGSRVFSPTTTFQLMTAPLSRDELEAFSQSREDQMFAKFKRMLRDDGID